MERKTIIYVKLESGAQVRVELAHITEMMPTPHEQHSERELTLREMKHVTSRLSQGDFSMDPQF